MIRKLIARWKDKSSLDPMDVPCVPCQNGYWQGFPVPHVCNSPYYCPCENSRFHVNT